MKKLFWIIIIICFCAGCGRKSKEDLYAEGCKQIKASNPGAAVVLLKSALEKDENYLDARFQLARAYSMLGKLEQAEKEFLKVLKQNPSRDEVLPELAGVYNASRKPEEAFKLGEQYLAKHPGSVEGLEILGISSALNRKPEDAERYLLQALAADPGRAKTKIELASLYASSGNAPKAKALLEELAKSDPKNNKASYLLAALEKAGGDTDQALAIYQKILANDPSELLASYRSGLIYLEKGQLDQADKVADAMMKEFPKRGDGFRLKGLVCYQRKNYTDAMANLQNSLKLAPSLEGYQFLGLCYYYRGELESALSQFRKILDYVPDSRQAHLMSGTILLTQKRVDDAISEIQKVLQKDDGDAIAHNMLGNAYMAKGMFDEGLREYDRATKINPKITDAYLKKGYYYFSHGKNSEGESELATAVQAAPDAVNSRLVLASYQQRVGNSAKALAVLRAGLTGKKGDAVFYNSIASVLFSQNKMDEGLKNIQKAKDADPAFPASYQNLVTIYAATGKYDKAVEEYLALLRYDPKNLGATLGLAALYELKGQDAEALSQYKKAAESRQPKAFLALASYYAKKKDTGKALQCVEEGLKIDSRSAALLEAKGRLLVEEHKLKEAVKAFDEIELQNPDAGVALKISAYVAMKETDKAVGLARKVIEKHPASANGYLVLASIYQSQKDTARAIAEVRNGVRVDGNNLQALLTLGNLLEASKDYGQAMSCYRDALSKKNDFAPALFAEGALLDNTGKKKEAMVKYREVLEKTPAYVPALNNLAYLSAAGYGNKEEALRLAISAFKQEPGNAGILDTLGFALLKNNRLEDAKKVLEKAVASLPNNPTVHYHLALAYKESGDKVNAQREAQKAVSGGDYPDLGAAKQLAAQLK